MLKSSSKSILHKFKVEYENQFQKKITHDEYEYPDWAEVKSELFNGWVVRVRTVNMAGAHSIMTIIKTKGLLSCNWWIGSLERTDFKGLCTTISWKCSSIRYVDANGAMVWL